MNSKVRSRILIGAASYLIFTLVVQQNTINNLARKVARQSGSLKAYKECFDLALLEMTPEQLTSLRSKMVTRRDFMNIVRDF